MLTAMPPIRRYLCIVVILTISAFSSAQSAELGIIGDGLFTQPSTGGLGGRFAFKVIPGVALEAEATRYFHSETYKDVFGNSLYNTGYQFLAGPSLRLPIPVLQIFGTIKGGVFRSTPHAENPAVSVPPRITSGVVYVGGVAEFGSGVGVRFDVGDEIFISSSLRRNNARLTGGIVFHF